MIKIDNRGHDNWIEKDGSDFWHTFLPFLGYSVLNISEKSICLNHYKQLRKHVTNKKCLCCTRDSTCTPITWNLVGTFQSSHPVQYQALISMLDGEVPLSLCNMCYTLLCNDAIVELIISRSDHSTDPIVCRTDILKDMLTTLSKDGIVLTTSHINQL